MGSIGLTFLGILLFLTSAFMMLLILVQRGKGGGLTGALGGMGGQSAFGSKAGDVFTKITVITAMIWIMLCMITIAAYNPPPRDSLNAQRKDSSGSFSSTDEESEDSAAGGIGGDSMGAMDSDSEADPESENGDIDEELENLIEDEVEAPAEIEVEMTEDAEAPALEDQSAETPADDDN